MIRLSVTSDDGQGLHEKALGGLDHLLQEQRESLRKVLLIPPI